MKTPYELYFEHLIQFADEEYGSIDEGGHYVLLLDGLSPEPTDDLAIVDLWRDMEQEQRVMVDERNAAIVKTDEQGFIEVMLYATDADARSDWRKLTNTDPICTHVVAWTQSGEGRLYPNTTQEQAIALHIAYAKSIGIDIDEDELTVLWIGDAE